MPRLPLFVEASETVLVDDARGRIVYRAGRDAHAWLDGTRGTVAWEAVLSLAARASASPSGGGRRMD